MRLLFFTDLHAKDQNPRSRTGSYREDVLTKLTEIVHLANEYEVDYLVNGADTFDHKSAWRTSMGLVNEMITILKGFDGSRHITVIGTHDVPTGQLWKLQQQPLGLLQNAGVLTVIPVGNEDVSKIEFPDVIFHGVHASYALDKDPQNYAFFHGKTFGAPVVTIAHGMIVPPGCSFFGDYTDANSIHTEADVVLYGHPHTPDGIYKNEDGTIFVGPGSVSRLGSYPYNRKRIPEVVLIEYGGAEWKFKPIPLESARSPEEVFADVIKEEEDDNLLQERVHVFVDSLQGANISDDSWGLEELITELRALEAEEDIKEFAVRILEEVS